MSTMVVEQTPVWARLLAEQPAASRRLLERAAGSTGLREPERFAPLCTAWHALDVAERRIVLALLGAEPRNDGSSLQNSDVAALRLVEVPAGGQSTCRPDLALIQAHDVLGIVRLHCVIECKSRSLAARNASTIAAALGTDAIGDIPDPLASLCTLDEADGTWRIDQLHVYPLGRWLPPGWTGHESASFALLAPGSVYAEDGWHPCDAEALFALLVELFLGRPREELLVAVAVYIAPPATHPYRALGTRTGRLRNTSAFGWRWSWAAWRREIAWISQDARSLKIGFSDLRGWELLHANGSPVPDVTALPAQRQADAEAWARDLAAASTGDRGSWEACSYPQCETPPGCVEHVDRFGAALRDRPGIAAPEAIL